MESTNAKAKAEIHCQRMEADLALAKCNQKRINAKKSKLQDNWSDWTQIESSNSLDDWLPEESSKIEAGTSRGLQRQEYRRPKLDKLDQA